MRDEFFKNTPMPLTPQFFGDLQMGSAERAFPDLLSKENGTKLKKLEQIGTIRSKSRKQGRHIAKKQTKKGNPN